MNEKIVPMPAGVTHFNACADPCDALVGPCSCGAWHHEDDWVIIDGLVVGCRCHKQGVQA